MIIYIGSARIDENGNAIGGSAGDQKQKTTPDYSGEVSMQKFYVDSRGWYVIRAKSEVHAEKIASAMKKYCNDSNVGYDQGNRTAIMSYNGSGKTECDCSSLIRRCVKDATGQDAGNFTTANEKTVLLKTGLFNDMGKYTSTMKLYDGDILVTCQKGHTVAVVSGNSRQATETTTGTKYTVICDTLTVRADPSTSGKAVGYIHKGETYMVTKISNNWGYVSAKKGWCSLNSKYIKKA